MGHGDFFPSGNYNKKPLTKKQLKKMREAYIQGNTIAEHVRSMEDTSKKQEQKHLHDELNSLFL